MSVGFSRKLFTQEISIGFGECMSEKKRRSKLEQKFEEILKESKIDYEYETTKIPYIVPESNHNYIVDFSGSNGIQYEVKGWLSDHQERQKYILVKQQHPELDLRFVFDNIDKLCGGTKYSHKKWCEKNGFKYCSVKDVETIKEWAKENT